MCSICLDRETLFLFRKGNGCSSLFLGYTVKKAIKQIRNLLFIYWNSNQVDPLLEIHQICIRSLIFLMKISMEKIKNMLKNWKVESRRHVYIFDIIANWYWKWHVTILWTILFETWPIIPIYGSSCVTMIHCHFVIGLATKPIEIPASLRNTVARKHTVCIVKRQRSTIQPLLHTRTIIYTSHGKLISVVRVHWACPGELPS